MIRTRAALLAPAALALALLAPTAAHAADPTPDPAAAAAIIAGPEDRPTLGTEAAINVYREYACRAYSAAERYHVTAKSDPHTVGARPRLATRVAARRAVVRLQAFVDQASFGMSDWGDWPEPIADPLDTMSGTAEDDLDVLEAIGSRGYRWTGDEELGFPTLVGEERDQVESWLAFKCE